MKPTPIEKFQYLVHLRATNVHLFYRLLSENVKVSTNPLAVPLAAADNWPGIDPSDLHPHRR